MSDTTWAAAGFTREPLKRGGKCNYCGEPVPPGALALRHKARKYTFHESCLPEFWEQSKRQDDLVALLAKVRSLRQEVESLKELNRSKTVAIMRLESQLAELRGIER